MEADKKPMSQPVEKAATPPARRYIPNRIPSQKRLLYLLLSPLLLAHATYGLWVDAVYLPGEGGGVYFHGFAAWIIYGAFVSAVCAMLSVCLDHYDRRNNEIKYQLFGRVAKLIAISFFVLSCSMHASGYTGGTKRLGFLLVYFSVLMVVTLWIVDSGKKKRR